MKEEIILEIFSKRFKELLTENPIELPILQKQLGLKSLSTLYRYKNGNMAPKLTTIKILSDIFNVNPVWLMGYDVSKEKKSTNTSVYGTMIKNSSSVVFIYGTIPAGIPLECIEDIIDTEEISPDMVKSGKEYFGLKIKGDSMSPQYLDNDIIILQKQEDCESGDDCVVMVNGNDGTFKRVFKNENGIILQPLNNSYQPMIYTNEQIENLPIRILGKVVELRRKFI